MKAGVTIKSGFVRRWNVAQETDSDGDLAATRETSVSVILVSSMLL